MSYLVWAVILLLIGLLLLVLEFMVPSSGLLGFLCASSIVAAIALGYMAGRIQGTCILAAVVVAVPVLLATAVKWWPETPIGRRMLIPRPQVADEVLPDTEGYRGLPALVGAQGQAVSLMLPGGVVRINGKSYDALSDSGPIEAGQPIRVVSVSMQRIVVRLDDTPLPAELADADPLAAPVADPFSEPLA